MKKFIITALMVLCGLTAIFGTNPTYTKELSVAETEIVQRGHENTIYDSDPLILVINMDGENLTFNASYKIESDDVVYLFGNNKYIKSISLCNSELSFYTNSRKVFTIKNVKISDNLREEINNLPEIY